MRAGVTMQCLLWAHRLEVPSLFSRSVVSNSCDPMNHSLPGSSVHGILQARILEFTHSQILAVTMRISLGYPVGG